MRKIQTNFTSDNKLKITVHRSYSDDKDKEIEKIDVLEQH